MANRVRGTNHRNQRISVVRRFVTTSAVALALMTVALIVPGDVTVSASDPEPTFVCFPSCSEVDGRMLTLISGGGAALTPDAIRVQVNSSAAVGASFKVGIFDGDNNGLWDSTGAAPLSFQIFEDPAGDGSGECLVTGVSGCTVEADPLIALTGADMLDNAWFDIVVPHTPSSLSGGVHKYLLKVSTMATSSGNSAFKIRTTGTVGFNPQSFSFVAAGKGGVERTIMRPVGQPRNYDGRWTFAFELPSTLPTLTEVVVWDGDLDYGSADCVFKDTDDPDTNDFPPVATPNARPEGVAYGTSALPGSCPTGDPAEDNPLGVLAQPITSADLGFGIGYRLIAPDGQQWKNTDPSGNLEWEQFRIGTSCTPGVDCDFVAATLPHGTYRVNVEGVDVLNVNAFFIPYRFIGLDPGDNPSEEDAFYSVRGTVWEDTDADGTVDGGEPTKANVLVVLKKDGVAIRSALTSAAPSSHGQYGFRVRPGNYTVEVDGSSFSSGGPLGGMHFTNHGSEVDVTVSDASPVAIVDFGYRNRPPVAQLDEFTTAVNTPVTITTAALLSNDSDPDGDTVTFAAVVTQPSNGQVAQTGPTTFQYTPNTGYTNTQTPDTRDSFTYRITDGFKTAIGTVKIYVTSKVSPTIAVTGGTFPYDGDSHGGACTVTGALGESLPGTISYSPGSGVPVNVGTYTVTCIFEGNADYEPISGTSTVVINPRPATVFAGSGTKVAGTADPVLSTTSDGFLPVDLAGITLSTTRVVGETVGSYATNASAVGNLSNYVVTYVPGTFTITPAPDTDKRMTGGGTFGTATHGFELHCNPNDPPNRLEVNWDKGNKFHLEQLVSATCYNDPAINARVPTASWNTYVGAGVGRFNGTSGYTAAWTFTDGGEPGTKDWATITITDPSGLVVFTSTGNISKGNQQAHK